VKNFSKKNVLQFFRKWAQKKANKTLKRKLAYVQNFEVLVVKLKQTLFFNLILKKNSEKLKNFDFFCSYFDCFVLLKTLTIDLVHFYDIINAENVGTGIPLKAPISILIFFNV
jgi:hypothetical protein